MTYQETQIAWNIFVSDSLTFFALWLLVFMFTLYYFEKITKLKLKAKVKVTLILFLPILVMTMLQDHIKILYVIIFSYFILLVLKEILKNKLLFKILRIMILLIPLSILLVLDTIRG